MLSELLTNFGAVKLMGVRLQSILAVTLKFMKNLDIMQVCSDFGIGY